MRYPVQYQGIIGTIHITPSILAFGNDMCQKWGRKSGFWVLHEIVNKTYANNMKQAVQLSYRVSHLKLWQVIWLCWGYSFWFLLILWVLYVHEKGTFMLNSSVFIFLMLRALYRKICKNVKSFLGEHSLNVTNVKLFSNFFFNVFGFFMPFSWERQLTLYISSDFPGIKNLNGLNDLNSLNILSGLNDLYSLISSKNL